MSVKGIVGVGGGVMGSRNAVVSRNLALLLCFSSFFAGIIFTTRIWTEPERTNLESEDCNQKPISAMLLNNVIAIDLLVIVFASIFCHYQKVENHTSNNSLGKISNTQYGIGALDTKISNIEMKLAAAKAAQKSLLSGDAASGNTKRKYFMVIGINTAFSSRKRRDSVRATWMPQGEARKKLVKEKGIVIRFVIGHSSTAGGILDKAIEAEEMVHGDFLRLENVEGYLELSAKTKTYFSTAVTLWDADFYVKVEDDVHVNLATLGTILAGHRKKRQVYVGCMKSGPVLSKRGVKYYEPESWKFGVLETSISDMLLDNFMLYQRIWRPIYMKTTHPVCYQESGKGGPNPGFMHILHKYVNEDVSLGSWFIGLDVEHVDDKRICCGTPPDCEWKAQLGSVCAASSDWKCSGICRSVERMVEVHKTCGEDVNALKHASF